MFDLHSLGQKSHKLAHILGVRKEMPLNWEYLKSHLQRRGKELSTLLKSVSYMKGLSLLLMILQYLMHSLIVTYLFNMTLCFPYKVQIY